MILLKLFPHMPGRDDPVARIRFSTFLSFTVLMIFVISSFLVFNVSTGNTVFIFQNIFMLALSALAVIILIKGRLNIAVYIGFVFYGLELLLYLLAVRILMPEYLLKFSYNILLLLAITFILGSSIICVSRTQLYILIASAGIIAVADYLVSNQSFYYPAFVSVVSVIVVTGAASAMFMSGSIFIESLLKEKNHYLKEISDKNRVAASALKTKSEFFAAVSHDIRTPLFSLTGFSELLAETPLTEIQREYLAGIKVSSGVLLELVNGVLHLAKLESGSGPEDGEAVSTADLETMLVTLFSKKSKDSGVRFVVEKKQNLPGCFVTDFALLSQLLINLLSNAFKFTDSGEIRVDISTEFRHNECYVSFRVSDTGIGIPESELENIFDPFVKVGRDTSVEGAGLGLAICRRGADILKGIINVESTPGKGSAFTLLIPYRPCNKTEAAPESTSAAVDFTGTLLVAEDNDTNRFLMLELLKSIGIKPDAACNGLEAVEMYEKKKYSHLILDIEMPYKSGVEAAREIRTAAEIAGEKVLIYAATADIYFPNENYSGGMLFDGIIRKPFSRTDLSKLFLT